MASAQFFCKVFSMKIFMCCKIALLHSFALYTVFRASNSVLVSTGQYCMPAEGVVLSPQQALLSLPELGRLVKVCAGLGVRKIRLTGGEPLVRRDLEEIIGQSVSAHAVVLCNNSQ